MGDSESVISQAQKEQLFQAQEEPVSAAIVVRLAGAPWEEVRQGAMRLPEARGNHSQKALLRCLDFILKATKRL